MRLRRPVLFFAFLLYRPQRSHWGSSHLPRLSIEEGHICVSASFAPGRQRNWDLLLAVTFSHTFSEYMTTHVHPVLKQWIIPVGCSYSDWTVMISCCDINGCRTPSLIFTQSKFPWGFMYIFDNFILESIIFLSIIIRNLLGNLKLISLPHTGEVTQLAYQYIVMQGSKPWFISRNLIWSHCSEKPAKCGALWDGKEVRDRWRCRNVSTQQSVNIVDGLA